MNFIICNSLVPRSCNSEQKYFSLHIFKCCMVCNYLFSPKRKDGCATPGFDIMEVNCK